VPCITTIQGAAACVQGIESLVRGELGVRSLQSYHAQLRAAWSVDPAGRAGNRTDDGDGPEPPPAAGNPGGLAG
jgi:carbamoyl-phosphate synthase large subunit